MRYCKQYSNRGGIHVLRMLLWLFHEKLVLFISDFVRSCRVRASNAIVCCYLRCKLHSAKSFAVNCRTMTLIINLSGTESISAHNCFIEETKLSSKLFLFNFAYRLQGRAKTIVCARGADHSYCFLGFGREHSVLFLTDPRFFRSNNNCFFLNKVARKSVNNFLLVITRYRRYI